MSKRACLLLLVSCLTTSELGYLHFVLLVVYIYNVAFNIQFLKCKLPNCSTTDSHYGASMLVSHSQTTFFLLYSDVSRPNIKEKKWSGYARLHQCSHSTTKSIHNMYSWYHISDPSTRAYYKWHIIMWHLLRVGSNSLG